MIRARVIGSGSYLPSNIVTNDDLAKRVDTSDTWIRERTGITPRHIALEGEKTSDLALGAARAALIDAGIDVGELDMIICATTTPDESFPATATIVQSRLGMTRGAAFDVQAVCSGFVYALTVADSMMRSGAANRSSSAATARSAASVRPGSGRRPANSSRSPACGPWPRMHSSIRISPRSCSPSSSRPASPR